MTKKQAIKIRSCFANGVEFKELHTDETNELANELEKAIEKQIPKKVELTGEECFCPNCRYDMMGCGSDDEGDPRYCPNCGQALDWRNEQ